MTVIGVRDLRNNLSGFVRRAEDGERFEITVAGRPAAVLAPAEPRRRTITGQELRALGERVTPLDAATREAWLRDTRAMRDEDPFRDPWAQR
jgi:prevent-host-death family protein